MKTYEEIVKEKEIRHQQLCKELEDKRDAECKKLFDETIAYVLDMFESGKAKLSTDLIFYDNDISNPQKELYLEMPRYIQTSIIPNYHSLVYLWERDNVIQEEYVSHKVKEELLKYNIKTYIEYSIEKGMFSVSRTYMYPTFVMTGNN